MSDDDYEVEEVGKGAYVISGNFVQAEEDAQKRAFANIDYFQRPLMDGEEHWAVSVRYSEPVFVHILGNNRLIKEEQEAASTSTDGEELYEHKYYIAVMTEGLKKGYVQVMSYSNSYPDGDGPRDIHVSVYYEISEAAFEIGRANQWQLVEEVRKSAQDFILARLGIDPE